MTYFESSVKRNTKNLSIMKNETLKLSTEEQNDFSVSALQLAISESISYANESGEGVAEYLVRDFEASPEGWNCVFDYSYDEISALAKEERKIVLIRLLAQEGYVLQSQIEKEFDLQGYIVIKDNYNDDADLIIAKEDWFTTMPVSETYGKYGQPIDLEDGGDYSINAYNYHNGHNWATVAIWIEFGEPSHARIDEEKEEEILKAYFNKNYKSEAPGLTYYEHGNFEFTESCWQGSWEIATVVEK